MDTIDKLREFDIDAIDAFDKVYSVIQMSAHAKSIAPRMVYPCLPDPPFVREYINAQEKSKTDENTNTHQKFFWLEENKNDNKIELWNH